MLYPIGIQTFENIRTDNYVYVDKTALMYQMVHQTRYVFLSRPRRFGKSLLLSTIEAYFQGKRQIFEGLAIMHMENDWKQHPVIRIDLNHGMYDTVDNLNKYLNTQVVKLERLYGKDESEELLSDRFSGVIERAAEKTASKVVILVDEYDKPLLETIGENTLQEKFRDVLRSFFGALKSQDRYIKFAMFTGITKFGKLNIFSELNNLVDISFNERFAAICGITKEELLHTFPEALQQLAERYKCSEHEIIVRLRMMYDGYRFTEAETKVFNPFSLFNAFYSLKLKPYWFETGTPTYLVELMRTIDYDLATISDIYVSEDTLSAFNPDLPDPLPILYQSGYLTIKDVDPETSDLQLGFPNEEVRIAFMKYLLPFYAGGTQNAKRFDYSKFAHEIRNGEAQTFMQRLQCFTADIGYNVQADCEKDFQNLLYIIFTLSSVKPVAERTTSDGRIDMVVETDRFVYVMEYKIDGTAEDAINQIDTKQYTLSWKVSSRKVIKIGANYSTDHRRITDYIIM